MLTFAFVRSLPETDSSATFYVLFFVFCFFLLIFVCSFFPVNDRLDPSNLYISLLPLLLLLLSYIIVRLQLLYPCRESSPPHFCQSLLFSLWPPDYVDKIFFVDRSISPSALNNPPGFFTSHQMKDYCNSLDVRQHRNCFLFLDFPLNSLSFKKYQLIARLICPSWQLF